MASSPDSSQADQGALTVDVFTKKLRCARAKSASFETERTQRILFTRSFICDPVLVTTRKFQRSKPKNVGENPKGKVEFLNRKTMSLRRTISVTQESAPHRTHRLTDQTHSMDLP